MSHPFGSSFESLNGPSRPVVESVHEQEYQQLLALVGAGDGGLISLTAPRAGYGKTTLLARVRDRLQEEVLFVPVMLAEGRRLDGELVLEEVINLLLEPAGVGRLSRLDVLVRRLFATALLPMVESGEVPCHDQEAALTSLRERPVEAFDFHREDAAIAQWAAQQFRLLGPRLSSALAHATRTPGRQTSAWVQRLFEFAKESPGDAGRVNRFLTEVREDPVCRPGSLEGMGAFLNLISHEQPLVLLLDEVDGLSGNPDAALQVASNLSALWHAAPVVTMVLSVNDDVWENAFVPQLPAGLQDRLEDQTVRLGGMSAGQAIELLALRGGDQGAAIAAKIDFQEESLFPRGVLQEARRVWRDGSEVKAAMSSDPPVMGPPVDEQRRELPKAEEPSRSRRRFAPPMFSPEPQPEAKGEPRWMRVRAIALPETSQEVRYQASAWCYQPQSWEVALPARRTVIYQRSESHWVRLCPIALPQPRVVTYCRAKPLYPPSVKPVEVPSGSRRVTYRSRSRVSYPPEVGPVPLPPFIRAVRYLPDQRVTYPPAEVSRAKVPVLQAPPTYREVKKPFIPTPAPIQGAGFAMPKEIPDKTLRVPVARPIPKTPRPLTPPDGMVPVSRPTYPPARVLAVRLPKPLGPIRYKLTPKSMEPFPAETPFVLADEAAKTRWVAVKAKLPPQPKVESPFAER